MNTLTKEDIQTVKKITKELKKVESNSQNLGQTQEKKVKMWNELTLDEKVERMKEQIKEHQRRIQLQLAQMESTIHKLKRHVHNKEGKAIFEELLEHYYGSSEMLAAQKSLLGSGDYF